MNEVKVHRVYYDVLPEYITDDIVVWKALVEQQGKVEQYFITSTTDIYEEAKKHLGRIDTIEPYLMPNAQDEEDYLDD